MERNQSGAAPPEKYLGKPEELYLEMISEYDVLKDTLIAFLARRGGFSSALVTHENQDIWQLWRFDSPMHHNHRNSIGPPWSGSTSATLINALAQFAQVDTMETRRYK